jgi:hypothetical protein
MLAFSWANKRNVTGCPSRYYAAGKAGSHKTTSCRLARARVVANVR